jgi:hypothetical protein
MIFAIILMTGFVAGAICTAVDAKGNCVEYSESTAVTCDPGYALVDPPGRQAECVKSRASCENGNCN